MEPLPGRLAIGRFEVAAGRSVHGELTVAGDKTQLYLRDDEFFHVGGEGARAVRGVLHDLTKVTAIACNVSGPGSGWRHEEGFTFAHLFPHFVAHGDRHIDPDAEAIAKVKFRVADDACLFYQADIFSSLINASPHIDPIVKAFEQIVDRDVEKGDRPEIAFFSGKRGIFNADTVIGRVHAENSAWSTAGGPRGVAIHNEIWCGLDYGAPVKLDTVTLDVLRLLRFFEIVVGRPQTLTELLVSPVDIGERESPLRIHWSLGPERKPSFATREEREPQPYDMLMHPADSPKPFAAVLTRWLARDDAWLEARVRFANCFAKQNRFGVDRIVAAANMYDILPQDVVPAAVELPTDIKEVATAARSAFKKLIKSDQRDSMLNAIGRLGKAQLKAKIRYRAQIVIDKLGERRFPDIMMVCDEAVDCRNHFVHGSEDPSFDYMANFAAVNFFTLTLEFIFALSDLIECGWDPEPWLSNGTTKSHPFGAFLVDYKSYLAELKALLPKSEADA